MNKPYINHIIIVEGNSDKNKILSLYDADIYICNGYDIKKEEIKLIKESSRPTIILTDPDEAGGKIRDKLQQLIPSIDLTIDINKCNKNNKHGVAECEKEELKRVLDQYISDNTNDTYIDNYTFKEFLFRDSNNKNKLLKYFGLKECSNNKLLLFVRIMNLDKQELIEICK